MIPNLKEIACFSYIFATILSLNSRKFTFIFLLILSACAKPTYVNSNDANNKSAEHKQETTNYNCTLKWSSKNYCLSWSWKKRPTEDETGSMILRVYKFSELDQFIETVDLNSNPQVVLWMPGMNHGSSPTSVQRIGIGTYQVDEVFFTMPGPWQIKFRLLNDTAVDEVVDDITF
jgi:hypothetical protein